MSETATHDRYYIGGANVAGILGISPYRSPLAEYLSIIGEGDPPDDETMRFFKRRKSFEPVAAEIFEERSGLRVIARNERHVDADFSFMKAEIDLESSDGNNVEIKTCHPLAARDWGKKGEDDDIPTYVTAQAMHGLGVTKRKAARVLALIGFDDDRLYYMERDEHLITALRMRMVTFWKNHVLPRNPPAPTTVEDVLHLFARDLGTTMEASEEIANVAASLKTLKSQAKTVEELIEVTADKIKLYLGGAATLTFQNRVLCTWKTQSSLCFNQKRFGEAHPDLLEEFKDPRESRVFRIK